MIRQKDPANHLAMNASEKPLAMLIAALLLGLPAMLQADEVPSRRPDIVVILVDDMGYGDPGCYNPRSKIATPHIDRLAREGMRFTDAHAPGPLCHPSRYGLMTGSYPFRTDITRWPKEPLIDEDQTTLASLPAGTRVIAPRWSASGISASREDGYDKPLPGGPVDRGFDDFFGIRASTDIPPYFYIRGDRAVTPPTGSHRREPKRWLVADPGRVLARGRHRAGPEVGRRAAAFHR